MSRCPNSGYLVDATTTIPTDPTDFHVDDLAIVGCNRLRCRNCKAEIRHVVGLAFRERVTYPQKVITTLYETQDLATSPLLHDSGRPWRLYLCKCNRWLEMDKHACDDPDPSDGDPQMAWECEGHPLIRLPHDIDGVVVATRAELRDLAVRGFHGSHPYGTRAVDIPRSAWLARLPARLAPEDAAVILDAALEALDDSEPQARARALELFSVFPSDAAHDKLLAMLLGDRSGFAGVANTWTRWTIDKTLEESAWRVLAPHVERDGRTRELARSDALAGRASRVVFQALASGDSAWLAENTEQIARVAPARVEDLVFGITQLPLSMPIKALCDQARGTAARYGAGCGAVSGKMHVGELMKAARTTDEMRFAAALEACPSCGTREIGALDLSGRDSRWSYTGPCPQCGTTRTFDFATIGDPCVARHDRFELGEGLSTLITPEQFLAVLDDAAPKIPTDPTPLSPFERRQAMAEIARALTSVSELLKLVPPGPELMPNETDLRLQRPTLEREYIRLSKLASRYRPVSSITQDALDAHVAWLRNKGTGPGHLAIEGKRLAEEWYGPIDLTAVTIVNSDLSNVDLGFAILDEAGFDCVVMAGAILDGASLTNAQINSGNWSGARLSLAKLNAAQIFGTDFSKVDLDRSQWFDAKVECATFDAAAFGNAVFNGATFVHCTFRNATFRRTMPEPEPTSRGARFIDCDFTGANFAERDLRDTTFVRCKLARAMAPTSPPQGLVLEDCDIDVKGFLASAN